MAVKSKATGATKDRNSASGLWLSTILLAALSLLFLPTALIIALGMLPSLVAAITDRDPARHAALTVGPMNFCGVLPQVLALWERGHTLDNALIMIGSPFAWGIMLGAAGAGWLIYYTVPPMVAGVIQLRAEGRLASLTKDQKKLMDEWGPEVSGATTQKAQDAEHLPGEID